MLKTLFATALLTFPLFAVETRPDTDCSEATADVYVALGAAGCGLGPLFTLSDAQWSSVTDPGFVRVPAAVVLMTPIVDNSIGMGFSSDNFSVTGTDRIRAFLSYTIDPPPPILDSFDLFLDSFTPEFPGFAIITANICVGDLFSNECVGGITQTLQVNHRGTSSTPFATFQFPRPVSTVDVQMIIELDANGESSQITGARQVLGTIPEPGTVVMVVSGLGLMALAARARARARRS